MTPRQSTILLRGLGFVLLCTTFLTPSPTFARESLAEWKQSLRESRLIKAASATSTQSNSVAAWKIAMTHPEYAAAVASASLPGATGLKLAREQYAWSLHPAWFDSQHPRLGALFQEEKLLLGGIPATSLHGLLPDTPFFNYFRWRRSLDPARFDYYHPNLGPLLAQDQLTRNHIPSAPGTISPPPIGQTGGGTPPGGGTSGGTTPPPIVPEPGSLGLLLVGSGILAALAARQWFKASKA
jgi:hypothetical protein